MSEMTVTAKVLQEILDLMKERLKRWVFKRFLKTGSDGADVTYCGRVYRAYYLCLYMECSTVGKRPPKKFDRRWLKDKWVEMRKRLTMKS